MIENIPKVLEQIKTIRGARFYFIIVVLFLFSVVFLFRTEISGIINSSIEQEELLLRRADDIKIHTVMTTVYDSVSCYAYLLYLYQPADPVIKQLEFSVPYKLKTEPALSEFVLHRQKELTDRLRVNRHVLLDASDSDPAFEKYHRINGMFIPYIYIYGIKDSEQNVIGEIHIWFKERPTEDELKVIDSKLSETAWYIH